MRFHCARANFYCDARRPQPAALENQDRRRVHFLPAPSRQLKAGVDIEGYQSPGAANRTLPFPLFRLGYDDVTLLTQSTGSLVVSARTANEGEGEGERVLLKLAWPASGEAFAREHELMRSLAVPGLAAPSERIEQPSEGALMVLQPHRGVTFSRWPDAPTSLPWRDALHIAQTLASTLAGLHDAGVVHRDLRPANLLLDQQARRTLLVDLHVAAADGVHKPQWNDPAVAAYLAPEQTGRLQHPVDHRADLYALGVLTYHLLTGRLPFSAGDALEWIHCHLARVPRSPIELASMPRGVSDLAMRLLAKSPDDRYQSAAALLYDLDRCLRGSDHDAESFVVGAHDARKRLQLSRKLYGRDRESATLQAAFHRVRGSARSELVLISGEAGSGKSSLAQMLRPVVTAEQGLFAAGKFDPHRREVPYAAFVQAFTDLLKAVLGESEAGVQRWRERLLQALGHNAQLMIQLVPALEQVIGQQPAALSLPPPEAELRFHMVFHQFVAAFVRADRPLVLFIDDLQWAEPASLDLLRRLLDSPAIGALLLIGAHRELEDTHPVRTLASDEQLAGRVTSISVPSLNQDALRALVAESLKVDLLEAAPLAATIGRHTGGNPLFATQLLLEMAEEGLLRFDNATRHWTWDSDAIAAKGCTQNVIELLLTKLQRLPPRALRALKHAACFGSTFASSLLERGLSLSHEQAEAAMAPAVDAGLAVRVGDGYRFVHDRVQETAYSLIEPHERARMRLHMGRLLVKSLDPHELEERLFDVVGALNDGAALIHDQADLIFLRQLNSKAGAKAKAAVDALAAHRYFTHARELLPPDAWSSCYDECFSLHAELAESAFLTGALEEVHALLDVMLEHAASIIDRARAYRIRMGVLVGSGQPIQGASVALEALRSMGLALPEDGAGVEAALRSLDVRLHERIAGRPLDALLELPRCDDPEVVAVMALLNDAVFPLFIAHPHLWPALGTRSVELSLIHGHTCESSFGYELLGDLHASRTQTLSRAAEFASLALRLDEQWSGSRLRHRLLMHHAAFVRHWFEPFSACRVLMERAVGEALEHGDIWMAANCMWFDLILALEQGESLQRVVTLGRRPEAFVQRPQLAILRWTVRLVMQAARCLQGLTSALNSLEDDQFSEAELVEALKRRGTRSGPLVWRVVRQMVKFLAGEPQQALIEAQQAASLIDVNETRPFLSSHHLFHLLARAALFEEADAGEQAVTRREFLEKLPLFEVWARACPANQQSRYAVLRAEWARLEGRNLEAATAYEEALLAARKHGNHQIELIASELAASFHAAGGLPTAAEGYLRRAEAACRRWGAQGLLPALQARHPGIALEPALPAPAAPDADAMAIAKASQVLAGPTGAALLPNALMRIAMEAGGAQRGMLLLAEGGDLHVVAHASVGEEGIALKGLRAMPPKALPWTVLHYVARTREPVTLSDIRSGHGFSCDPYLQQQCPRSVLCLPLQRGAELIGVLYMEHRLVADAFPPERVQLLSILAAQAAISLETSRLYASLKEREARIRRLVDGNIIGILFAGANGRVFDANDACLQVIGRTRDDLIAGVLNVNTLTPAEYHAADDRAMTQLLASGRYEPYEKEFQRADGKRVPVLCGGTWLDPAQHAIVGFVLDLSERRHAEADRAARHAAELANRAKSEFLANMSHELRTPLNGILGYAQLLLVRGGLNEAQRRGLDVIRESGNHLLALINDILDLSRIEARRFELTPAPVPLAAFLLSVCDVMRVKAEEKHLRFAFVAEPDLPAAVVVDQRRLRQILLNLLSNAVKFTDCGSVTLHVRSQRATEAQVRLRMEVEDTGIGIPADQQRLIFEPFEQVGPPSHRMGGTGLGLTITQALVQAMGGTLQVSSEPGRGTTFAIELVVPVTSVAGPLSVIERAAARYKGPRRRILVVDDVAANRALLTEFLLEAGFDIEQAANGAEALEAVASRKPHLVLMDSLMPEMNGMEATRRLRAHPDSARLPIVAITASASDEHRRECLQAGANDVLGKPVELEQLLTTIGTQLQLEWATGADMRRAHV